MENTLNVEKNVQTEYTVFRLIIAQHEKNVRSSISVQDGFEQA